MKDRNSHKLNRREFITLGVAGAASLTTGLADPPKAAEGATPPVRPVYRTLGRTGLKVAVVGLGANQTSEYEVIQAGFSMGINYVDTARVYMGGLSEETVGKALKGWRDKVYVATKIRPSSNTRKEIIRDVEKSLSALSTDYIDVLQLHALDERKEVYVYEVREALLALRKAGKVRFFGVTTHKNETEVVDAVVNDPEKFFDIVLITYNFKSDPEIKRSIAKAAKAGIGIVAMKTQTGGYKPRELGGASHHQAALRWVLQDTNVTLAVPGMKDIGAIRENTSVMGILTFTQADEEMLVRYGAAIDSFYCRFCGKCEPGCPNLVEVSTINRCLMYSEGYRSPHFAQLAYKEIPRERNANVCLGCEECATRCVHGLNVDDKMRRAQDLFS